LRHDVIGILLLTRHFVTCLLLIGVNYADDTSISNDIITGTNIAQHSFYIHKMAV